MGRMGRMAESVELLANLELIGLQLKFTDRIGVDTPWLNPVFLP